MATNRLIIDPEARTLTECTAQGDRELALYSPEAFSLLSRQWVNVGWSLRYSYGFTWLGFPIIQLPEDIIRIQEVIHRLRPTVVIETGVAHGGSLILYASLMEVLGEGRVIGVDVEIRPHNRAAIEAHPLSARISLVEGDSVAAEIVQTVREMTGPKDRVLVLLDSNHTRDHVLAELRAYGPLVTEGSYIVATDGIMADLADVPGGHASWDHDNPQQAVRAFLAEHTDFVLEEPEFPFNEGQITERVTHWPAAYLRRVR